MSAQILPLGRASHDGANGAAVADDLQVGEDRRMAPSRGIVTGILISLPVWAVAGVVIYLVL
ncbi:MAG: hypothetical protein P4L71_15180 [Acetobacteraceae bacterium]|nr:hypothetical protein [Acetobacteraceae bacterium]